MSNTITLSREELFDLTNCGNPLYTEEFGGKHDCTDYIEVYKIADKLYKFKYSLSYEWGFQGESFKGIEVEPYEVTVTKYRPIK